MTRLVFNGKFLSQQRTGVQRVAAEMLSALDRLAGKGEFGLRDMELCLAQPCNATSRLELGQFRVETVGQRKGTLWEQLDLPRYAGRDLLVNLCNVGPLSRSGDIVFIHDAQAFLSPRSYSVPFRLWYRTALPILAARASRVVTVSRYAAEMLERFGVAPAEKISIIPNGVDHVSRVEPDRSVIARLQLGSRPWIVGPANTQQHKNIGVLLHAFRSPRLADVDLVLVGPAVREDFQRVGVEPPARTVFAGRLSDAEMCAVIKGAEAFAFPSTTEGFGLPPLEAMLLGTPAVVAPCGALPEICGEAVLYASPEDPKAWVSALVSLVGAPEARSKLADLGRARAAQYTWSKAGRQLATLLGT